MARVEIIKQNEFYGFGARAIAIQLLKLLLGMFCLLPSRYYRENDFCNDFSFPLNKHGEFPSVLCLLFHNATQDLNQNVRKYPSSRHQAHFSFLNKYQLTSADQNVEKFISSIVRVFRTV